MFTESVLSSLKSGYFTLIFNFYGNKLLGSDEKTEKLNSETKSLKRLIFLGKVLPSLQLSPHSAVPLIFFVFLIILVLKWIFTSYQHQHMIVLARFILFMGSSIFEHKRISLGVKLFFLFLLHQHDIFLRKRLYHLSLSLFTHSSRSPNNNQPHKYFIDR